MDIQHHVRAKAEAAKRASHTLKYTSTQVKNDALLNMADLIEQNRGRIKKENERDLAAGREHGLAAAMMDRLELNDQRIAGMVEGLQQVATLPDPVGSIERMTRIVGDEDTPGDFHVVPQGDRFGHTDDHSVADISVGADAQGRLVENLVGHETGMPIDRTIVADLETNVTIEVWQAEL